MQREADPVRVEDDVTLALRGERIPLRNAVSSAYNRPRQELLVATPAALFLYGKMLTAGGDLLATLSAEENAYFQFVVYLPWLDAYSVIVSHASGKVDHRIVSSDLKTSLTSHTLLDQGGQFYTALANPYRRELITADTDGGIRVWALRVIATAHNDGGFKGVLRVHTAANSTKKPYYRHLRMSFDGNKIFAATTTKVYVFDAASCHRLPCCLREDRRTIFSIDCGNRDNSVYIVFRMNLRKISKYSFVVKKGAPQFRKVGEHEHDQELAAFIENDNRTASCGNGVVMIDSYGRFTTTEFMDSTRGGNDSTPQLRRSQSAVPLPYNPPSERYNALHVDTFAEDRNFAFAVWSTGFCIVELFFADAQGRLLCDAFNGEQLKRLDGLPGDGTISIYQSQPSAQVVMFEEGVASFRFAALPKVPDPSITEEGAEKSLPIVDYVVAADAVIALWPHGLVEKHNLSDNRVFTIAEPFESVATTIISLSFGQTDCVAVGDSTGAISIFPLANSDTACQELVTRKPAHANDSVSTILDLDKSKPAAIQDGHSLLSVGHGGEVKRWLVRRVTQSPAHDTVPDFVWELVACFRTYSPDVSIATFEAPEFLFCGFDGGSFECWRLPSTSEKSPSRGLRSRAQTPGRISVVKRALHAIDLHLAPVRSILCESGAGNSVAASPQPVADNFSWVFSYDEDAIVLVWCFSLDFFFPHRRIKVHECIKGIYISPSSGSYLDLFAYIDRCIDRIDHLGPGDKEAVRLRLRRGRELSAQRDLNKLEEASGQTKREEGRRVHTASSFRSRLAAPTAYDQSSFGVPSVRINITLPAVEQKVKVVRKSSAGASPVKPVVDEVKLVQPQSVDKPAMDKTLDTKEATREEKNLQNVLSASPTRILDRPPSKAKPRSPVLRRNHSPQRKKRSKKKSPRKNKARDANASFLPGQNSLPSSFQQTKPRVYRKAVKPLDSLSSQARCAVITAGSAYSSSSSSSSSSEEEDDPAAADAVEQAKHIVRSTSAITLDFGLQEKVSVVSLVEDEVESILLLDYRPGSRRPRSRRSKQPIDEDNYEAPRASFEIPFLPWDRMSEHDRRVELMAASKSKCIQEGAERDEVFVPPVEDFESVEISVQLGIRAFTRWFAATHRHHQRIRERFLAEEVLFAAVDPVIHQKLADMGLSPPPKQQVGLSTSTAWQEFVSWYCLGLTTRHQTIPPEVLQRERLKARTEYLELRLRMVAQSELEVQEEEERAGPCEEECEPPQRVYIFEHFVKRSLSDNDSPTSWENTSPENRQKEITLALMDPAVQIAAMRNDIELPDVSGSCMEDFDMLQLAGKFIPWWRASRNIHRRDFLNREVHEASTSKAILELLSKEQHADGETINRNQAIKDFFESYFRSDKARHTFLKKKLFYLKRKSRIASVARYGKLPAPLVVETLPLPLVSSFEFVEREIVEEVETEEFVEPVEEEEGPVEPEEVVGTDEQPKAISIDNQREQEEEELRRLEGEKAKITLELIYMAREDALSREYNNSFVDSDEEVEESSLVVPKRTDFSRSYFFGNLPMHYRKVASSGWRAGSGVDNGDEEHEEEEQLERERERQRLLDEQEAERLLELERQAERARIEKEREEKAFQFRRVRQAELKKVLVHQAELEAQRKADLEIAREMMEQRLMQREDEHSCWHRDQLLRDQTGMQLEDQLAFQIRKELREAAVARLRLLLHEQACMSAEDQRSFLVGKEFTALEHQRAVRRAFLSELYTPFHPFYNGSAEASESFLPRIQWRLEQEQLRRTPVKSAVGYTIPLQDALVLDELDQEPYLARDSRKFKLLMGLPLRTPSSQKRPRIPTADAIIAMQQQQRQLVDLDEERHESSCSTGKHAPLPHKVRPHSRTKTTDERSRLPEIMPKIRSVSSLTDLKEACRKQDSQSPTKRKTSKSNQQQQQQQNQQNQSLPFFRGNMLVQGHGQPRSKDYA